MNRRKKAAWSMASFLAVSLEPSRRMPGRVIPGSRWNSKPAPYGNPAMRYTFRTLQTGHGSTFGSCRAAVRKFSGGGTHVECGAPPFHTIRLCAAEFFRHRVVCQPGAFRRVHVCFRDGNRLGLPL